MKEDDEKPIQINEINLSSALLDKIFIKHEDEYLSIFNFPNELKEIASFLMSKETPIKEKIFLIKTLNKLFTKSNWIIPMMRDILEAQKQSLYKLLIDIYLNSNDSEAMKASYECLSLLIMNIDCQRETYESVFQSLSIVYHNKDTNFPLLTKERFINHITLLKLFYRQKSQKQAQKQIRNYIYFTGKESLLFTEIKAQNQEESCIKLTNGFYLTFWFWLEKDIDKINNINSNINIVNFAFDKGQMKISLPLINQICCSLPDMKRDIDVNLKTNDWNQMTIKLSSKKVFNINLNNDTLLDCQIKEIVPDCKITNIILFENFIGKVTSVIFLNCDIGDKLAFSDLPYGLYKDKYLYQLLKENKLGYLKNSDSKYIRDSLDNFLNISNNKDKKEKYDCFDAKKMSDLKQKMIIYCPFAYDNYDKKLDDLCNNYCATLSRFNGVNVYSSYDKNIEYLGGINSILPIIELMYTSITSNRSNYILLTNIFDSDTFYLFWELVSIIVINKPKNLYNAEKTKFFTYLALFLEKFPKKIFDQRILQKLLDIINMDSSVKGNRLHNDSISSFFEKIILNEKIIAKFSPELQGELWEKLNILIETNAQQLKKVFNVFAICVILKFYDSNKEKKFCCKKHAALFDIPDRESKIIVPEFFVRTKHLLKSLSFIMKTTYDEKDLMDLIHFLTLDLSPCLQKAIIKRIAFFFQTKSDQIASILVNSKRKKDDIVNDILKEKVFEILLYALSVSLLDVRVKIMDLLIYLINAYPKSFESLITNDSMEFITKNILPYNLRCQNNELPFKKEGVIQIESDEIVQQKAKCLEDQLINDQQKLINDDGKDEINIKIKQIEPNEHTFPQDADKQLIKLFDEEVYKKKSYSMWKKLFQWFKDITSNANYLNHHVLIFLIQLSISTGSKYIYSVSDVLLSKLKNAPPTTIQEYTSNDFIFNWIIETLFVYSLNFNNERTSHQSKNTITNLKIILEQTMKEQKDDIDNTMKIIKIFAYAEYFQTSNQYEVSIMETRNVLRELLEIVLSSRLNFMTKTKLCFAFLLQNNSSMTYCPENITIFDVNKIIEGVFDEMKSNYNPHSSSFEIQWKDCKLVDQILDYYLGELSLMNINVLLKLKKTKIDEIIPENIITESMNKKKSNRLFNLCSKLMSINDNTSIIKLVLFLLSVYYYNSHNDSIKAKDISDKYRDLILFCILTSINISNNEEKYDQIQKELFSLISFGLAFLKIHKEEYYEKLIFEYIHPILIEGERQLAENNNNKIKIFSFNKTNITASSLFSIFILVKKSNNDNKGEVKMIEEITFDNFILPADYLICLKEKTNKIVHTMTSIYFTQNYTSKTVIKEQKYISETITKIIPNFDLKLKERSSGEYLEQKVIRHSYKKVKKKLFSWRGLWSDRYSFFDKPYLIKQKTINHYTSEMTKPLLGPILDVDYYLPKFAKFKSNKLFMPNDHIYKVNLDIDLILIDHELKDEEEKENDLNDKEKNDNTISYLNGCYRSTYPEIWEGKINISNAVVNLEKKLSIAETKAMLIRNSTDDKLSDHMYNCCIVKPMTHIKGLITVETEMLRFVVTTPTDAEIQQGIDKGNLHYDTDRKTCYGSFITQRKKSKDNYHFKLLYSSIKFIFKRVYFYSKTGVEFYTFENKCYFINFETPNDMEKFFSDLLKKLEGTLPIRVDWKVIGYEIITKNKDKKRFLTLENLQQDWVKWKISTMEYLLWINILANRSFNDITQYPVFPWVIANYKSQFDEHDIKSSDLRDLQLPMGMMDISPQGRQRKARYLDQYDIMKGDYYEANGSEIQLILTNQKPYLYGSHYSNPAYVSHYLTRLFPFATTMIEIQGNRFDDPDRLFNSVIRSFDCTVTQKCDIRELIPEFFFLPEMFINLNNLDLAQEVEVNLKRENRVILPKWAKNQFDFVSKQRIVLENKDVNNQIRYWIDLIFGIYQKGKKAEEKNNVFMANTYENAIKLNIIDNKEEKEAVLRLVEMGLTPNQIFTSESQNKEEMLYSKAVNESNELIMTTLKLNNFRGRKVLKMKLYGNENLLFVLNDNYVVANFLYKSENNNIVNEKKPVNLLNESTVNTIKYKMNKFYGEGEKEINRPILNYSKGTVLVLGGFWDGRIEITELSSNKQGQIEVKYSYFENSSPVVVMEIDKTETLVICGTMNGQVNIFKVDRINWELKKKLYHHDREVTSISINNTLNMFATSAKDGYIMLYLLPSNKLIRTIRFDHGSSVDQIFLSALPLPEILVQSKEKKTFFLYNINGRLIKCVSQGCDEVITPITFTSSSLFSDYLMYGTNQGTIIEYSYPMFENAIVREINKDKIPIKCVEFSEDKSFCYVWFGNDEIFVMHDRYVYVQEVTMTLNSFGFFV